MLPDRDTLYLCIAIDFDHYCRNLRNAGPRSDFQSCAAMIMITVALPTHKLIEFTDTIRIK
jgi:hypothetical protein